MNEIVLAFSLFISVIILFIIGGLCICSYTEEKRDFNDGVCKFCGSKLHYFDMDSGGARGYMCENCMKLQIIKMRQAETTECTKRKLSVTSIKRRLNNK